MIDIGFRAHDFGSFETVEELACTVASYKQPATIQLALGKVIPSARKWQEWDEEYISSVRDTLASHGVSVAVIGCYINPVHPDEEKRAENVARFKRSLELNKAFGCRIVATETGSWTPDITYSAETFEPYVFDIFCKSLEEMLNAAVKNDAIVAIEPVSFHHTICTMERMVRVLEKFQDEHLKVLLDPVNLVPKCGIPELDGSVRRRPSAEAQRRYFMPLLDAFQDRLCALHGKDYILDDNGLKYGKKPILTGVFDWPAFFKELRERGIDVPMSLENHDPKTLRETLKALSAL